METALHLALSLAIGLLIGTERGWQERESPEGRRIAGIRTFGLIGLLGGFWALIGQALGILLLGIAFVAVAAVLIVAYIMDVQADRDVGITTLVAALLTFAMGAAAVLDYAMLAAASAVVTTAILALKGVLHRWLKLIQAVELHAALKLLLISVVLLPVLPNQGYGPWGALNPFEIWWMVVLIAGISFCGYVAVRLLGVNKGLVVTGFFGGLVSSTATTINLSRLPHRAKDYGLVVAAIVVAAATMFPRMLIEIAVVNVALVPRAIVPIGLMAVAAVTAALLLWRHTDATVGKDEWQLRNPVELKVAIQFGLLLAAIMILVAGARAWFGEPGLYVLAGVSGLADVDAITLSLARLDAGEVSETGIINAITIAAMVNSAAKAVLASVIGGKVLARRLVPVAAVVILAGAGGLFLVNRVIV
jgi:uncharacterized membrane protein (DUF4010 family)